MAKRKRKDSGLGSTLSIPFQCSGTSTEPFRYPWPATKTGKPVSKTAKFLFILLFSYAFFYNDFTISDYTASIIWEVMNWKCLKGSRHGLVVELTWHLPSESEENHKNLLVQPVSLSRLKDGTYWTQSARDTDTLACYLSHISLFL